MPLYNPPTASGGVVTVNGNAPDGAGNVVVPAGVATVNGTAPDGAGNVVLAGTGIPLIYPESFNAIGNGTTTDTTAFNSAVTAADSIGGVVYLTAGKTYAINIDISNKNFHVAGNGKLVPATQGSPIITGVHTPTTAAGSTQGDALAVTNLGNLTLGPTSNLGSIPETHQAGFITVAMSSLNQFRTGDVWRGTSEEMYVFSAAIAGGTNRAIGNKALTSNVATITTVDGNNNPTAHGFAVNQFVLVEAVGAPFDGQVKVLSIPTSSTFTYAAVGANVASTPVSGARCTESVCYKAFNFPVGGVSFPITPGSFTPVEEETLTGVTSGATGQVGSYALGDTTGRILFNTITGTFINGESLRKANADVVGTIAANGSVVMKGTFDDTYAQLKTDGASMNIKVRKLRTDLKFVIAPGVTMGLKNATDANTLDRPGQSRSAMVQLFGVPNVDIDLIGKNTSAELVSLFSCWNPRVKVRLDRAPNMALSEGAYGYGVELVGSCEAFFVDIFVSNVRHGFTTNNNKSTSYPTSESGIFRTGTVNNGVITGTARGCWGGGFDNHAGSRGLIFRNCVNYNTTGLFRDDAVPYGFQNRSIDTTYEYCTDYGSMNGFKDGTASTPFGRNSTTRYIGCKSINHQFAGFLTTNSNEGTFLHAFTYIDCLSRGDGRATVGAYATSGFKFNGTTTYMRDCVAERFTKNPIEITDTTPNVQSYYILGFTADYSETAGTTATGMRLNGGTGKIVALDDYSIIQNPSQLGMPASVVTADASNTSTIIRWGSEVGKVLNTDSIIPRYAGSTIDHRRIKGSTPDVEISTVAPTFGVNDDLWFNPTGKVWSRWVGTGWV